MKKNDNSSNQTLLIRRAKGKDREGIVKLLRNTPEFKKSETRVAEELLDSYYSRGFSSGYYIFVSAVNSSVSGMICFGPTPLTKSTWDIYWIAVKSDIRSKGIGKALIEFAENYMKKRNAYLILIETSAKPQYKPTQNFYKTSGYKVVSQIDNFYEQGDHRITFAKHIE